MASQSLDISLNLSSDSKINGILTLNSTENDTLTFDDTDVVANSVTVAHGSPTVVVAAAVSTATYVYIKNTDVTNFCDLKNDAGNVWGILHPGEFIFFCVNPSDGFEIQANTADCVVDYVTFKKG